MDTGNIKEVVKEKYGEAALRVLSGGNTSCSPSSCCGTEGDPITSNLYVTTQSNLIPEEALKASLGCGNPTAMAVLPGPNHHQLIR